jgi:DNA-binding CsgD family transcriptional regulator
VAEQLLAATEVDAGGVVEEWVVWWLAGSAVTLAYRAPALAVRLLSRVREVADVDSSRRERLDAALARALFVLGRNDEAIRLTRPVLDATRDPDVAGEMAWLLAQVLGRGGQHREAIAVASATLDRPDLPLKWVSRLRSLRARHSRWGGAEPAVAAAQARVMARQAEDEGIRAGDTYAVAHALHAQSLLEPDTQAGYEMVLALEERALAVAGEHPETIPLRLLLLTNRGYDLDLLDRPREADLSRRQALTLAERYGTPRQLASARLQVADSSFRCGQWDDAIAELDANDTWDGGRLHRVWGHGLRALIAVHRDEPAELARHLPVADEVSPGDRELYIYASHLLIARALASERDGRPAVALAQLGAALDRPDAPGGADLYALSHLWLPDVVRLAISAGQPEVAARAGAAAHTQGHARRSRSTRAVAAHCQALLDSDPAGILTAAGGYAERDLPLFAAQAWENAAALYAEHGHAATARTTYTKAVEVYTDLGALWDIRRGDARLRRFGIRRGGRRGPRRPSTGWKALTPVELQVAGLVAAGRSNPDIARQLFLSAHTVRTHVSHILTKLDAQSRVDIAREAQRHHLDTHPTPNQIDDAGVEKVWVDGVDRGSILRDGGWSPERDR